METAKLFESNGLQTIRLPKKIRLTDNEVYIQNFGDSVMITPKNSRWLTFMNGLNAFSDDFMANGRDKEIPSDRNVL